METTGYRIRGVTQLILILFGQSIGFAGYILTHLFRDNTLPANWTWMAACWYGLGILIHIGIRIAVPYADPLIAPIVLTLTGIGLAELHRMDLYTGLPPMLTTQFLAVVIGIAALFVIVFLLKDPRRLKGFPFLLSALGFLLLLLPLVPGLGTEIYGSRIWIEVAGFSFQPAEIAKIVLAASFAAYLADKADVLSLAGHRFLGMDLPRMRDLGPVMLMWGLSLAIMVFENDLGTSLLFFGLFVMMIYVATGKISWVVLGLVLFGAGGAAVLKFAGHVQRRVDFWLHPFDYPDTATQIIQAQFGLSHGGLIGSGWGLGRPDLIIFASSDMISAAIGEEIGIVGLMGVIVLYALLVFRGLKTALVATDPFIKLFAAGLSFAFLLQTFAIIAGVTRLLPLTGLTTPFLSQGGSSMIANWILIAVLLVISNQARRPQPVSADAGEVAELGQENTQIFSTRELAQIGTGAIHPVQALNAQQIRLTAGGVPVAPGAQNTWTGNEELTQVVSDPAHLYQNPSPDGTNPGNPGDNPDNPDDGDPGDPDNPDGSGADGTFDPGATQPFNPFADEDESEPAPPVPARPAQTGSAPGSAYPYDDTDDFFLRGTE